MINLLPDAEQVQVIDAIAALMKGKGAAASCKPEDTWPKDAHRANHGALAEFGLFGLSLPEDSGGIGYGAAEEALSYVEIGRALGSPSFAATSLAVHMLHAAGKSSERDALVSGQASAAFAVPSGPGHYLIDADSAEYVIVAGRAPLALHAKSDATAITPSTSFDPTVPLATCNLGGEPLAIADRSIADLSRILLAAMAVGTAEAALTMATEYAGTREQFGQPIGAFQAVKHHCANLAVAAHCAATQTALAAVSCGAGTPDRAFLARGALFTALEAAIENARMNIQIHGGIGFTAEARPHLFLKRAHLLDHIAGGMTAQLEAALEEPLE